MNALATCNAWADTVLLSVIFVCVTVAYVTWRKTGGRHYGDRR